MGGRLRGGDRLAHATVQRSGYRDGAGGVTVVSATCAQTVLRDERVDLVVA